MRSHLEALLRAKQLDRTLAPVGDAALSLSADERDARLLSSGWASVDQALGGGFPRGECSEIVGSPSSGRTALLMTLLTEATRRGEIVALVDALDRFDPRTAVEMADAAMTDAVNATDAARCVPGEALDLSRLLWVRGTPLSPQMLAARSRARSRGGARSEPSLLRRREVESRRIQSRQRHSGPADPRSVSPRPADPKSAGPRSVGPRSMGPKQVGWEAGEDAAGLLDRVVERALKAFGLIAQAGGFGVVALDLADVPMPVLRRLPFTTWFRLQRLIEGRPTVGIVLAPEPVARSARGVTVRLGGKEATRVVWMGTSHHARVLTGFALQPQAQAARRLGDRLRVAASA